MAYIKRQNKGSFIARWWRRDGSRAEVATGEYVFEAAQKKANNLEAQARFWELHEDGVWQLYANMGFSPRYCHESFTHAKHLRFDSFKKMLIDGGVTFQAHGRWRDSPKKKPGGKKHRFRGKLLTLGEIIAQTGASINTSALRWRLDRGWGIEAAITTPVMSRSEAGAKGAEKTNQNQAKRKLM